jgi:hypothetical protein
VIIGGIDLSIPFVIGFANVVAAQLYGQGWSFVVVCLLVAVLAMAIGGLNGLISRSLDIHPLIVTLAMSANSSMPCRGTSPPAPKASPGKDRSSEVSGTSLTAHLPRVVFGGSTPKQKPYRRRAAAPTPGGTCGATTRRGTVGKTGS